jgi:hypothetical protein
MDYADYPENWKEIRARVLERAKNADGISQCECHGECGREHKGSRCLHLQYGRLTTKSKYKVILTTAHLCHTPNCARLDHLKSMCQPCHQIFDLRERQKGQEGKTFACKNTVADLTESAARLPMKKKLQSKETPPSLLIPDSEALLLPLLKLLADDLTHSSEEIRGWLGVQFKINLNESVRKLANGKTEFHSNVDLALAYLQGARNVGTKAIEKAGNRVYKITNLGKFILSGNPRDLTIKDLQAWK